MEWIYDSKGGMEWEGRDEIRWEWQGGEGRDGMRWEGRDVKEWIGSQGWNRKGGMG